MATSDLLHELTKDSFRAAPDVEKKVIQVVLKQLDDQSGDVSTLAVRCLPPLISGCSLPNVKSVIDGLLERLCCVDGKDAEIRYGRLSLTVCP
jgi:cullin-associated NEDD8-dissociated protein 1|tara:strand:- start:3187 stop:3465 length:279 start_codon:yes stop_codon:yes gene_type:complete